MEVTCHLCIILNIVGWVQPCKMCGKWGGDGDNVTGMGGMGTGNAGWAGDDFCPHAAL